MKHDGKVNFGDEVEDDLPFKKKYSRFNETAGVVSVEDSQDACAICLEEFQ